MGHNHRMRSLLKSLSLALAFVLTISASTLLAADKWQKIPVKSLPTQVVTGSHKLFGPAKITKAEKSDGTPAEYRLTIQRRGKGKSQVAIFDARGQAK